MSSLLDFKFLKWKKYFIPQPYKLWQFQRLAHFSNPIPSKHDFLCTTTPENWVKPCRKIRLELAWSRKYLPFYIQYATNGFWVIWGYHIMPFFLSYDKKTHQCDTIPNVYWCFCSHRLILAITKQIITKFYITSLLKRRWGS